MIDVGSMVLVALPHRTKEIDIRNLRPFDKKELEVTRKVLVKTRAGNRCCYYELKGAVSKIGKVPFGFLEEWLVEL